MSSAAGRIVVTSVGACTVFGRSARRLALGYRAGAAIAQTSSLDGGVVRVARAAADLEPDATLQQRFVALAAPALAEAAQRRSDALALILALPVVPADAGPELALNVRSLLREIADASGVSLDVQRSASLVGGYAAGALAMAKACDLLGGERGLDAVIIGGVDSWLPPARLASLIAARRVRYTSATKGSKRGELLPGEGAAFLVLERERTARAAGREPLAVLGPIEVGRITDHESRVTALAAALSKLVSERAAVWFLSETNGETARADAWAKAIHAARDASGSFRVEAAIDHATIAREIGDLGAATGPVAAALATLLLVGGDRADTPAVIVLPSDDLVAGFVLERAEGASAVPEPPVPEPLAVSRPARLAFRVLEAQLKSFREVEHRVPLSRRAPLLACAFELGACLAAVEDEAAEDASLAAIGRMKKAAAALAEAATRACRSAGRRKHAPEPEVQALDQLAGQLGELATELHEQLAHAATALPAARTMSEGVVPLLLSRGLPSPLPLRFEAFARRPSAAAVQIEDPTEEAEDEEDPAGDLDGPPASSLAPPLAVAASVASDCIESIGLLWLTRTPRSDGHWSPALQDTDERLLAQLDYLFTLAEPFETGSPPPALAGVAIDVVALVRRSESAFDPARAFANTLVLACCSDPRLAYAAAAKARGAPLDLRDAFVDALSLGSSAWVVDAVAELCLESDGPTVELALEVLRRRRGVPIGAVVPHLFHPLPSVREAAARALGASPVRAAAAKALESRLVTENHPRVTAAAVEGLLRLQVRHAEEHLLRGFAELVRLGTKVSDEQRAMRLTYARMSAALGRAHDVTAVAAFASDPQELECLGWFGRVTGVARLIETMEGPARLDESLRRACARALARVTGLVPEASPRGTKLVDGKLATVDEDRLELDDRVWRAYWQSHGAALGSADKYRFGRKFTLESAMAEHVATGVRVQDRAMTSLEIAIAAPPDATLADERSWAGNQLAAMRFAESR